MGMSIKLAVIMALMMVIGLNAYAMVCKLVFRNGIFVLECRTVDESREQMYRMYAQSARA